MRRNDPAIANLSIRLMAAIQMILCVILGTPYLILSGVIRRYGQLPKLLSLNVGDTHDPPVEELRAASGQENKYGVPGIPSVGNRLRKYPDGTKIKIEVED